MKFTLISYLILAIVMIFIANRMLEFKNNLTQKVLGSYYTQMDEINKESGMDVYNLDKKIDTEKPLKKQLEEAQNATY